MSLKFAPTNLRKTEHIVLEAFNYDSDSLKYADKEMLDNEFFLYYIYIEFMKSTLNEFNSQKEYYYDFNGYSSYDEDDYNYNIDDSSYDYSYNNEDRFDEISVYFSKRIQEKLCENSKYLLEFETVNVKPAKK